MTDVTVGERNKVALAKDLLEKCVEEAQRLVSESGSSSVEEGAARRDWFPDGITLFDVTFKISEYFEFSPKLSGPDGKEAKNSAAVK